MTNVHLPQLGLSYLMNAGYGHLSDQFVYYGCGFYRSSCKVAVGTLL